MRKIIIACIVFASIFCMGFTQSNNQIVFGHVHTFYYQEEKDFITTVILDTNGKKWKIDDFVAPVTCKCLIIYDDMGTENPDDDKVLQINTFWKMDY